MKRFLLLVGVALVVAACSPAGADDDVASLEDTTVTTGAEESSDVAANEDILLEFAQCMRDNGVENFPDPTLDGGGNIRPFANDTGRADLGVDEDTLQAAQEACLPIIEDLALGFFRENRDEIEDSLFEFAECMRDNGFEMPDPDFSNGPLGGGGGPFGDIDIDDPDFQEAAEECAEVFGAGFRVPGQGRGGDNG